MDFFENYAIVAMQSDNVTFYACKIIKVTSGFNLKKTILSPGSATVQKIADFWMVTPPGKKIVFFKLKPNFTFMYYST